MDAIGRLRAAAERVMPETPVRFAFLFGSLAQGQERPGSDVDVAVWVSEASVGDTLRLRLRLAARLATEARCGEVEVVVLNEVPLSLAGRVQRDGVLLWSRDEPARVRWESLTARRFEDWRLHAEPLARQRLRRLAAGGDG